MTIILQRHSTLVLLRCILVGLIAQSICQLILVLLILIFQPASPGSAYLCCFYQQANQAGVVLQSLLFHSGLDSSFTMLDCRDRGFFGGLQELAGWLVHSFSKLTKAAEKISNSQTVESEWVEKLTRSYCCAFVTKQVYLYSLRSFYAVLFINPFKRAWIHPLSFVCLYTCSTKSFRKRRSLITWVFFFCRYWDALYINITYFVKKRQNFSKLKCCGHIKYGTSDFYGGKKHYFMPGWVQDIKNAAGSSRIKLPWTDSKASHIHHHALCGPQNKQIRCGIYLRDGWQREN